MHEDLVDGAVSVARDSQSSDDLAADPDEDLGQTYPSKATWLMTAMQGQTSSSMSSFRSNRGTSPHPTNAYPSMFNWKSDDCSAPLTGDSEYAFDWPCRRHDFGYRNLKKGDRIYTGDDMWDTQNKAVVDTRFLKDLAARCGSKAVPDSDYTDCMVAARTYHGAVSWFGGIVTIFDQPQYFYEL